MKSFSLSSTRQPHSGLMLMMAVMAAAVLFWSCGTSDKKSQPKPPPPLSQTLKDSSKPPAVEKAYHDTVESAGIQVTIPRGWDPADDGMMSIIENTLSGDTSRWRMSAEHAYGSAAGANFLVSKFAEGPRAGEDFAGWAKQAMDAYLARYPNPKATQDWLTLSGLKVLRLSTDASGWQIFKLIVENDPPINIDIMVPDAAWPASKDAVEASVQSISRVAKKTE